MKLLFVVKSFVCLESTMLYSVNLNKELMYRMGRPQQRFWNNHHVSVEVKHKAYRVVVLSALLHGSENWTIYQFHEKKLHVLC